VRFLALLILVALALPATASAQERTIDKSPLLWSTVNLCDTARHPDTMGIRASMPGSGRRGERMFMRFKAQFFSEVDNRWHNFTSAVPRSGWIDVGHGGYRARQSGWRFPFEPRKGQQFELRGVVNFEWRKGTRVVRRAAKRTRGGHRTAVSDPRGFSSATCRVSAD
jgi:hypothetical protein